mmetsp:Transcript_57416/g.171263  ORF Transcript_57416/g.171263 Transcript_57416/m.171263 type:complete len:216 (-) Transcript_57416:555-1202(-)
MNARVGRSEVRGRRGDGGMRRESLAGRTPGRGAGVVRGPNSKDVGAIGMQTVHRRGRGTAPHVRRLENSIPRDVRPNPSEISSTTVLPIQPIHHLHLEPDDFGGVVVVVHRSSSFHVVRRRAEQQRQECGARRCEEGRRWFRRWMRSGSILLRGDVVSVVCLRGCNNCRLDRGNRGEQQKKDQGPGRGVEGAPPRSVHRLQFYASQMVQRPVLSL